MDDLLTIAEAATLIGVDESQVRRYVRGNILPATRYGARLWLIRRGDAQRFKRPDLGRRPSKKPKKSSR